MTRDNDPRATPWGMPGEMQWGEVVASETPAAPDPHDPNQPSQAEREFFASLETAHAPAIPTAPPLAGFPPGPAAPAAPAAAPTDEREFFASLETAHAPAFPSRVSQAPHVSHVSQAPRVSYAPRPLAVAPLAAAPVAGGISGLWGALREVLVRPFPRNLVIGVGVAPFVLLVAGFILQALLAGGDWAHGGLAAGVDALLLAIAIAIGSGVRYWLGRRAPDFLKLASALLAGLVIVGGGSLAASHQLHYLQGQAAERVGAYSVAVAQYKLYGEAAPNALDVARADIAWGEQLMAQHRYAEAAQVLSGAVAADPKDTALTTKATTDLYNVYSSWLSGGGDGMPYGDAATFFASYRASSACDTSCQATAAGLEAQTRFLAGTQLAAAGDYAQAAVEFETIQAQFPSSDYAAKAHATGAQVYLAYGKQLLSNADTCKGVVSASQTLPQQYQTLIATFQTLTTKYGDTPEGRLGAQMMAAPQPVSGTLTGLPSGPAPTIYLSTSANPSTDYFSDTYSSAVDAKSGAFSFANVSPGDYNLHTERGYTEIRYHHSSSGNLYNIHVVALCPLNLGQIPY